MHQPEDRGGVGDAGLSARSLSVQVAMKIAFVGNQGGRDVIAVYADMVRTLEDEFGAEARFAVWLDR